MSSSIDPSSHGPTESVPQAIWQNLLSTVRKGVLQTNGTNSSMVEGEDASKPMQRLRTNAPESPLVDEYGMPRTELTPISPELKALMKDGIEKASQVTTKDIKEITNLQSVNSDTMVGPVAFLPAPHAVLQGDVIKKDMGFLALLGLVLTLLAKANSSSWSQQFATQNSDIQAQIALAPQIGDAIRAQAAAQSEGTLLQAQQQLVSGIMNITAFAAAGVMGLVSVVRESSGKLGSAIFTKETQAAGGSAGKGGNVADDVLDDLAASKGGASKATQKELASEAVAKRTAMREASAMKAASNQASNKVSNTVEGTQSSAAETIANTVTKGKASKLAGTQQAQSNAKMAAQKRLEQQMDGLKNQSTLKADNVDKAINAPNWKEKMSRGFDAIKSYGGKGVEKMGSFLDHASRVAMLSNLLVQGVDGIAGSIYQTQIAATQIKEGEAQALSKTLEQMSGVYGQLASQAQSLGDQSLQNMQQALQLLQNAADSSTSTTASIFH